MISSFSDISKLVRNRVINSIYIDTEKTLKKLDVFICINFRTGEVVRVLYTDKKSVLNTKVEGLK